MSMFCVVALDIVTLLDNCLFLNVASWTSVMVTLTRLSFCHDFSWLP
jgi:hypothetical protein